MPLGASQRGMWGVVPGQGAGPHLVNGSYTPNSIMYIYKYLYMYMYIMYYICIIYIYGISPLISGIVGVIYMDYQPLAKWDAHPSRKPNPTKKRIYIIDYSKHSGKIWQIAVHPFPSED